MSKTRILILLVVVLVLLNSATLTLLFIGKRSHGPQRGPAQNKHLISERLHFNEEQMEAYEGLIATHQQEIGAQDEAMMEARDKLYSNLSQNDSAMVDLQLQIIAGIQASIEAIHFKHFSDIRGLCTAEQLPAFKELSADLAQYFSRPKPPKKAH